ncbi:MAG: glycosyltransferase family 2 protein, partial [Acidimicrobiia bacterium]|nr:glycosyltransferase family 2 protein [Acidimicrobiia bacterium]
MRISVVTPAYNEAQNLPVLHEHLSSELDAAGVDWEWVIVDDHSGDDTFGVVGRLHAGDRRVRGVRLARNSGSHVAIACGLHLAAGDAAIVLAGDMQDPPAIVAALLARWREGAQVVWAARRHRPGDRGHAGFAVFYYWMMRRVAGLSAMPARGADCFLADRAVLEAFRRRSERGSVLAMVTSLGFRQALVEYDKAPRLSGRSGWTLARKVGLVADSLT